ncbi:hypothetical protein [Vagococcus fluvialis]|uniref:hypothetical protein n=1 Tax=Vagococcus fluvialis TaxID=2738 RepID=UPI0020333853|nr:hypothetical protein [Vagococcus fluvialis]MCM2138805.1 hypothetical protein [Vagococcus fluvialis]
MNIFKGQSDVHVPSITSNIAYPYSKELVQAYRKYFDTDVKFIDGIIKMLVEMLKVRKDYFILLPQFSKTGKLFILSLILKFSKLMECMKTE